MLTKQEKIAKLKRAVVLLGEVDFLQQEVIEGDVCYENFQRIQNLIDDFECDIEELEGADND